MSAKQYNFTIARGLALVLAVLYFPLVLILKFVITMPILSKYIVYIIPIIIVLLLVPSIKCILPDRIVLSSSKARSWLLVVAFANAPLASFASGVFYHIPLIGSISGYVVPSIFIVLIILNLRSFNRLITSHDIIAAIIFVLFILLSFAFNVYNRENIINNMGELIFGAIPYYFIGLLWKDDKETMFLMYKVSIISILVNVLYLGLVLSHKGFEYSMSIAYACLPSIMVCLWWAIFENKKIGIVFACLGGLFLLFLGTRGPIVIFIVYTGVILWARANRKRKTVLVIFLGVSVYLVMFTNLLKRISIGLASFARSMGFSSRIFDILSTSSFFGYTSGRDVFYETAKSMIYERPFLGYGIYGEWQLLHNPAHRIWLEIWCHFGLVLGTGLIIYMLYTIYRGVKSSKNIYIRNFILIWAIHLVIRGIFGSSYLDYYSFFLWGLCNNQIRSSLRRKA